jgi:hypothetical protein
MPFGSREKERGAIDLSRGSYAFWLQRERERGDRFE